MTALVELKNASKTFGAGWFSRKTVALRDFSLSVEEDDPTITALVGESGSGKTTIARLLLGIIPPTTGEVLYRGKPVGELSRAERRHFRRDVQVIFQDPFEVYNPFYKVDHALHLPVRKTGVASSRDEAVEIIENTLRQVGLNPRDTLGRYPHQLSGGQRQRVGVARALAADPPILLMDEPFGALDPITRAEIQREFLAMRKNLGKTIVFVTHDVREALLLGDRIGVMETGRLVWLGHAGEFRASDDPRIIPYLESLL